jgi:hypothetical protein
MERHEPPKEATLESDRLTFALNFTCKSRMERFDRFPRTFTVSALPGSSAVSSLSFSRFCSPLIRPGSFFRRPYSLRLWRFSGGEGMGAAYASSRNLLQTTLTEFQDS